MHILITKFIRYKQLRHDLRFSFAVAFRRLEGILESVREEFPGNETVIMVAREELEDAQANVKLLFNERFSLIENLMKDDSFFAGQILLVIDEQGFYATGALLRKVLQSTDGQAAGTWEDPERILWSFNYEHACHFFVAPPELVRRHLEGKNDFLLLQESVLNASVKKSLTAITPQDIPAIYSRALRFNPYPYHYYVESTSRCNSNCIMCPFHSTDPEIMKGRVYVGDKGVDMPLGTFKSIIDEISSIGWDYLPSYRHLQVTPQMRGEPTVAPGFREMLLYAKGKNLKVGFTTNGSTLHEGDLAEFLVDIGIDEIVVSIDGDIEEYSRMRPALDYHQVESNLRMLRILRDKKGKGTPLLYTKRVHLRSTSKEGDRRYVEQFAPLVDGAGITFENFDDFHIEGKKFTDYFFDVDNDKRLPCVWASDVAAVKADGAVDVCFGASQHYIGNIKNASLLKILDEGVLRRQVLSSHCFGDFTQVPMCRDCTCWKHNYHIFYEEGDYCVKKNPLIAYWSLKPGREKPGRKKECFAIGKVRDLARNCFRGDSL